MGDDPMTDSTLRDEPDEELVTMGVEVQSWSDPPPALHPTDTAFDARYRFEGAIGEGGMGTVDLYRDTTVGRRVAVKKLHGTLSGMKMARHRFTLEARIQGQLEHPSIVPVYDLGVHPDGSRYFTMKRVRGVTLERILEGLRDEPEAFAPRYSLRRLLSAFAQVCLTVDYAHSRGVIHRDLKPANIMLGDFGEVYVLDWGVAHVSGMSEAQPEITEVSETLPSGTAAGAVLGTLGYMPPEQATGQQAELSPAADVYALGAILFEILTREPLHPGDDRAEVVESTLSGTETSPRRRAPHLDIAPELDAACVKATAFHASKRFRSARELHAAIERFLDGEQDLAMRREMAQHYAEAAASLGRAERVDHEDRRVAMQLVGRALALDPDSAAAMDTMLRLLQRVPSEVPPEVERALSRSAERKARWMARVGAISYAAMFLYVPLVLWVGVLDWLPLLAFFGAMLFAAATSVWVYRSPHPSGRGVAAVLVTSSIGLACLSALFGPLLFVPGMVGINAGAFSLYMPRNYRSLGLACATAAVIFPYGLELAGVLDPSYAFVDGALRVLPGALAMNEQPIIILLVVTSIASVAMSIYSVGYVRDELARLERRLHTHAWILRELVPVAARAAMEPGGTAVGLDPAALRATALARAAASSAPRGATTGS